jgi:type III pantothenate kinase
MSSNLLAISVGNSRTQIGLFAHGELTERHLVPHDEAATIAPLADRLFESIRTLEDAAVYIASVNDPVADTIAEQVSEALDRPVIRMERDVAVPIGRQTDPEATTGEDRLLNAAAAFDRAKQACVIIDAGTAMTVDFVDGEGTFHGGAILPGARMMLRALHEQTAQLPLVEFTVPEELIGHNTEQAIRVGVYHALRGAARELVEKYAEIYRGYPKVIATGGDAEMLFEGYDLVETIVPELTLQGMAVAHRHATTESE